MKKLVLLLVVVMLLNSLSLVSAFADTGTEIDISCVDGNIVVSGSFDGGEAVGETYTVVLETYDENGVILKTDKSEAAEVVSGSNEFSLTADVVANVQPTKAYIETSGSKTVIAPKEKTIYSLKVLAIGNSFSVDSMRWLYQIANDLGVDNVVLGNLYIGGCSLYTHYNNATNNNANYEYYKNTTGSWVTTTSQTMLAGIQDEDWNLITLQQVSQESGRTSSFEPYLTNLISYINTNKTNPYAKIAWHQTWAYAEDSTHSGFANYSNDQMTMYNAIASASQTVDAYDSIDFVIPAGTAIQNARTSFMGDTLNRDGYHLDYYIGRYIAGLAWFHKITGLPIDSLDYVPSGATYFLKPHIDAAVESVKNAVTTPYAVTAFEASTTEDGTIISDDFNSYEAKTSTEDYAIGANVIVAGNWANTTSKNWGGWNSSDVGTAVVAAPDGAEGNNALTINAQTGWQGTSAANARLSAPSVEYVAANMNQSDSVYNYKFDIYRNGGTFNNAGGGIRFNISGTTFYELYFMGNNGETDGTLKTSLSKVNSGTYTRLEPTISSSLTNNQLVKKTWYTVNLTYYKGKITWTVTKTSDGTVVQTGTWKDSSPITGKYLTMRFFAAGQGGEYVTFDNVTVTKTTPSENPSQTSAIEDFESYVQNATTASTDLTTGGGRYVTQKTNPDYVEPAEGETTDISPTIDAEVWYASSSGFGYDSQGRAGIVQNPTKLADTDAKDNVLAIESRATYPNWNLKPRVIYENLSVNNTDKYTYKFDFYKSDNQAGGGIIFNFSGSNSAKLSNTNYYAIEFVGRNDHAYGYDANDKTVQVYSTVVVKNGVWQTDAEIITVPDTYTYVRPGNDFIPSKAWYTVEVSVYDGEIDWTVTNTSGAVIQTGSWTDPEPLTASPTRISFFAGSQGGTYMYFDNLSVSQSTVITPDYEINGDLLTVAFSPEAIKDIGTLDTLQIAVAFYESEPNKLLSVATREVTDFSEFISEDFVIDSAYDYAKVFFWSGELSEAAPVYTALEITK